MCYFIIKEIKVRECFPVTHTLIACAQWESFHVEVFFTREVLFIGRKEVFILT